MKAASRRETLGSTSFKVQEFEPDRMKVQLDLTDAPIDGWLRSDRREGAGHRRSISSARPRAAGASKAS